MRLWRQLADQEASDLLDDKKAIKFWVKTYYFVILNNMFTYYAMAYAEDIMDLVIHKGSYAKAKQIYEEKMHTKKHFVFDLDETIGSFSELDVLWRGIQEHMRRQNISLTMTDQDLFCAVLDLYPEFLRHGILTIFEFLYAKKIQGHCGNVLLYTNNQCPGSWTSMIVQYIENCGRLHGLFDQIIHAFKIDGIRIETNRSSHAKSFCDLIKCTVLPKTAEFCFVDNTYFPKMVHGRVFYIQPKSYFHALSLGEIVGRFVRSDLGQRMVDCGSKPVTWWETELIELCIRGGCNIEPMIKTRAEHEMDIQVSKKMMYHIKEFFYLSLRRPKTRKISGRFLYNSSKKKR